MRDSEKLQENVKILQKSFENDIITEKYSVNIEIFCLKNS